MMIKEQKSSPILLRPRFKIEIDESKEQILNRFKNNLQSENCLYCSKIVDEHIFLDVPAKETHFWSPQLHIEILEGGENKAIIKGLFGPKPQVWTLFMFVHFVIGVTFIVFAVMAYSRWSLNGSIAFPLTITIILPIVWVFLYFLGQIGKQTGHKQIEELHDFMMQTIEKNHQSL